MTSGGSGDSYVLVVDDDAELVEVMDLALTAAGVEVVTAANGLIGLERIEERMPALILLDMRMPLLDGWQFAKAFHERYGQAAPIVVITAAEDARRRAAEIDVSLVLSKPFELAALLATVHRFVAPRPLGGPAQFAGRQPR